MNFQSRKFDKVSIFKQKANETNNQFEHYASIIETCYDCQKHFLINPKLTNHSLLNELHSSTHEEGKDKTSFLLPDTAGDTNEFEESVPEFREKDKTDICNFAKY